MVKVKNDLTGKKFGRWKVLYQTDDYIDKNGHHYDMWHCRCSCKKHTERDVRGSDLRRKNGTGGSKSCGCINTERIIELDKNRKKHNQYDLTNPEYGIGYTTNTNNPFYFDYVDYELICKYTWYEHLRNDGRYHSLITKDSDTNKSIKFHHIIGCKNYDHIDHNPLNNRRCNLRLAKQSQNCMNKSLSNNNTSGIIGVSWCTRDCRWKAQIGYQNQRINLGYFMNKKDAIIARLNAEKKYFKEFAPQKHLYEQYGIS